MLSTILVLFEKIGESFLVLDGFDALVVSLFLDVSEVAFEEFLSVSPGSVFVLFVLAVPDAFCVVLVVLS